MSSAKRALGYRQADGVAIGGAHAHTHTHRPIRKKVSSRTCSQTHTCSRSVCQRRQCFSVSPGARLTVSYLSLPQR